MKFVGSSGNLPSSIQQYIRLVSEYPPFLPHILMSVLTLTKGKQSDVLVPAPLPGHYKILASVLPPTSRKRKELTSIPPPGTAIQKVPLYADLYHQQHLQNMPTGLPACLCCVLRLYNEKKGCMCQHTHLVNSMMNQCRDRSLESRKTGNLYQQP